MSKKANKKKNFSKKQSPAMSLVKPPSLSTNIISRRVYRFFIETTGLTASNGSVTVNDLINVAGAVVTVVNTTAVPIKNAVKINRITIWATSADVSSIVLTWGNLGSTFVTTKQIADISLSSSVGPCVSAVPPANSLQRNWLTASNEVAFSISRNTSATAVSYIVDTDLSHIQADDVAPTPFTVGSNALGTLKYPALNFSQASATNHIVPFGLTSMTK